VNNKDNKKKLTVEDVRAIRGDDRKQWQIADDYDVDVKTIGDIKRGKTWKNV
jgi:hypothetical protein